MPGQPRIRSCLPSFHASSETGPSIRGYTTCQVFSSEFGHVFVVPMSGTEVAQAIKRYFKEVEVSQHLICDQATEQVKGFLSDKILN